MSGTRNSKADPVGDEYQKGPESKSRVLEPRQTICSSPPTPLGRKVTFALIYGYRKSRLIIRTYYLLNLAPISLVRALFLCRSE